MLEQRVVSRICEAALVVAAILLAPTKGSAQRIDPSSSQFSEVVSHALSWQAYWWGDAVLFEHQGQSVELKILGFGDLSTQREREKRRRLGFGDLDAKGEREEDVLTIAPSLRTVIEGIYSPTTRLRTIRVHTASGNGDLGGGLFGSGVALGLFEQEAPTWSESLTFKVPNQLVESYRASISDPSRYGDLVTAVLDEHRGDYIDYNCKPTAQIPAYSEMDPRVFVLISCNEERWVSTFRKQASGGWTLGSYPKSILSGTSDFRPVARRMQSHSAIELSLE